MRGLRVLARVTEYHAAMSHERVSGSLLTSLLSPRIARDDPTMMMMVS